MQISRTCSFTAVVLLVIGCRSELEKTVELIFVAFDPGLTVNADICGRTSFDDYSEVIHSPLFPEAFTGSFSCNYVISVGRNNSISLEFIEFQMESYLRHCAEKWMTISCSVDGSQEAVTNSIVKYCGVKRWTSSLKANNCPFVLLEFGSNSASGETRFQLRYAVSSRAVSSDTESEHFPDMECGQTLYNTTSGVITLPSNSSIATAKINCTYTIALDDVYEIGLNVSYLDLLTLTNSLENCDHTSVQIMSMIEGTKSVYQVPCEGASFGFTQDPYFPFTSMVSIAMISNNYDPRNKLQIPYYTNEIETRDDSRCGRTSYTDRTGIITSPRFPLSYPHNLNCSYRVTVDPDKMVTVQFLDFRLEAPIPSGICTGDWLTITCLSNGSVVRTPTWNRKFCGTIKWTSALRFSNCSALLIGFFADLDIATGGFQIQYSIASKDAETVDEQTEVECGNDTIDISNSTGQLTLPVNSGRYLSKINCTYMISTPQQSYISIKMSSINTTMIASSFPSCLYDYFKMECIEGNSFNQLFTYCQPVSTASTKATVFTNCSRVRIQLYSESFDFREAHRLNFRVTALDAVCGLLSHHDSTGEIASPGYPSDLPPRVNCTYSIYGGINQTISLTFNSFRMGSWQGVCDDDKVTMNCRGSSEWNPFTDTDFCGGLQWPKVIRFFNCFALDINYISGFLDRLYTWNQHGIQLNYTVSPTSELEFAPKTIRLSCHPFDQISPWSTSLSLPHSFQHPFVIVHCIYLLIGGSISEISFDQTQLNAVVYNLPNCSQDYLQFTCVSNNGSSTNTFGPYCGDRRVPAGMNGTVFINCNSLTITLRTPTFSHKFPRHLSFKKMVNECGNTSFTSPNGTIASPRYPNVYPIGLNCLYTIILDENKTVVLNFSHFSVEGSPATSLLQHDRCDNDWLIIRCFTSGDSVKNGFLNRRLCGSKTLAPIVLSGCYNVTLNIVTDYSNHYGKFKLEYSAQDTILFDFTEPDLCGRTSFTETSGNISSPSYPVALAKRLNCTYLITAGENKSIALEFLQKKHALDSCDHTYLTINCLPESKWNVEVYLTERACGSEDPFNVTLVECQVAALNFVSDAYVIRGGFKLKYTVASHATDESQCGNLTFTNPTGIITSPGYPNQYPHGLHCTYSIVVPDDKFVSLEFYSFSLAGNYMGRCIHDWVQIECLYNGTTRSERFCNMRFCGDSKPIWRSSKFYGCSNLNIHLVTDFSVSSTGFLIYYFMNSTDTPCGLTKFPYSLSPVTLISPFRRYRDNMKDRLNCTYTITTGRTTETTFSLMQLNNIASRFGYCSREHLKITCLFNNGSSSKTFGPYCYSRRVPAGMNGNVFTDCDSLQLSLRSPFYGYTGEIRVYFIRTATITATAAATTAAAAITKAATTATTTTTSSTGYATVEICHTGCHWEASSEICNCLQTTLPPAFKTDDASFDTSLTDSLSMTTDSIIPCSKECNIGDGTYCKCLDKQTIPVADSTLTTAGRRRRPCYQPRENLFDRAFRGCSHHRYLHRPCSGLRLVPSSWGKINRRRSGTENGRVGN